MYLREGSLLGYIGNTLRLELLNLVKLILVFLSAKSLTSINLDLTLSLVKFYRKSNSKFQILYEYKFVKGLFFLQFSLLTLFISLH